MSESRVTVLEAAAAFLGVIAVRIFIDFFIASRELKFLEILTEYLHNFFFFAIAFLLIWIFLSLLVKENPSSLAGFIIPAFWLIIFPPILDMIKTGGSVFWSFYLLSDYKTLWSQFLTVFGHLPSGIVYFGTKIVFLTAIFSGTLLIFYKTRNIWKSLAGAFGSYVIFFAMGAFPSLFFYAYSFFIGKNVAGIRPFEIAQFFGTPAKLFGIEFTNLKYALAYNLDLIFYPLLVGLLAILWLAINRKKLAAFLQNARWPQLIYHGGLLFIGLGLGIFVYPGRLNINFFSVLAVLDLLAAVFLAWLASVIFNDLSDVETDRISNPSRPFPLGIFTAAEYRETGIIFFLLSLIGGIIISPKFGAILVVYQFLAWAYSCRPYRLKRFPVVATAMSAAASLTVLFLGFALVSGLENIQGLSWRIIALLFISFTLVLPLKDFRDIEGDKKDKVWTIPVIFGEKNGRLINAVGVFIPFILSVFFFNETRLFWWAVLSGSAAFLVIITKKPRQLFWWVLGIAAAYGVILVKIIFF